MTSTAQTQIPSAGEADAIAAGGSGLDLALEVIDSDRLSERLERRVTITHVRLKPDHSLVVAHTDKDGVPGWTALTVDSDKFQKAQQRAEDTGEPITVHQDSAGAYMFSGSIWSDPPLAKELAEAAQVLNRRAGSPTAWKVLRYNPRRRVVATVDSGKSTKVIRVLSRGRRRLLDTNARWRELGLPVPRMTALGERGSAFIAPLWGVGDLSDIPHEPAAAAAGAAIAQLHSSAPTSGTRSLSPANPFQASAALGLIAPWLAERSEGLAQRCANRLAPTLNSAVAELHGDLSPDQILLAAEGSHKIRIIDLDRAGRGHPLQDIGSWTATCRHSGNTALIEAFLLGYGAQPSLYPADLHAWEAYAHLSRATDFFRRRDADWPAHTVRALDFTEEALDQ